MSFIRNARFATLLAVALALVLTGVAAGAAGQALVLGIANNAGSSARQASERLGCSTR